MLTTFNNGQFGVIANCLKNYAFALNIWKQMKAQINVSWIYIYIYIYIYIL
jgi:hypothetical protein